MFTFIDSFTPPTCPSAMPEKTKVYIADISKIKRKIKTNPPENKTNKQKIHQPNWEKRPNPNLPGLLSISRKMKWCPS